MWELAHKEDWAPKSWLFQIVVLRKTFESPLDSKAIKAVSPKGNQPWIVIRSTDAEAPLLWPPDAKNWLIRKYPDGGKDWRHEEKMITEGKMIWWHHQLNGHEFDQALGDDEGQEVLHAAVHGVPKSWTWLNNYSLTTRCNKHTWNAWIHVC